MTKKISHTSAQLTEKGQSSRRVFESLTHASYEMARGASKQAKDLGEAKREFEAIAQAIHRLSKHSGEWLDRIHGLRLLSENGDASVAKAERSLHEAQACAKRVTESILALEAVGSQLLEMANHVEAFARKSSFLAINTGLEITRGESRGMAALLGEIKKLADESAAASEGITSLVRQAYQRVPEAASEVTRLLELLEASSDLLRGGRQAVHRGAVAAEDYENQGQETASESISLVERGDAALAKLEQIKETAVRMAEEAEGMAQALQDKEEGGAIAEGAAHLSQLAHQLSQFVEKNNV